MPKGSSKRHHYVPQFYLRQFACREDRNKVRIVERHGETIVTNQKSISRIGYEESMHDFVEYGLPRSIEGRLNRIIETPFSSGETWKKITSCACASLDETDKIPLYGFARHLQRRNLETLRFIEAEVTRFRAGSLDSDLTAEEGEMHSWISASTDNAHALFRAGAMDTAIPDDADKINIIVCQSSIPLRTSTNPTLLISSPGRQSVFGSLFDNLRTWWLSLDRHCGVFIVAGGPPNFSHTDMPGDAVRVINRQYLVQHCNSMSVRYLIADDDFLDDDLDWAGYCHQTRTTHGHRWRKVVKDNE
ncbi:DUF4238 domain-containing protein [Erythrobacter sp. HA6-11]